jgi:hypothetical protein
MQGSQYHGGFDHPVRAFVIGVTLLVLLFGGFAVGVEAGTHPRTVAASTIEVSGRVGTTVVTQRVNRRVVTVQGEVVKLPGTTTTKVVRVIVVRDHQGRVHYYLQPASTSSSGEPLAAATVVLTGAPITITGPPTTVTVTQTDTAPGTTATETVTETAPPTTTGSSNATTTTPWRHG